MKKQAKDRLPQSAFPPAEIELQVVAHYHQPADRQPKPRKAEPWQEIVELVTTGRGWLQMKRGEWRKVGPGDLLWHGPGEYTIGRSDDRNPYRCLAATFKVTGRKGAGLPRISHWPDLAAVRQLTTEVVGAFYEAQPDRAAVGHYLYSVLWYRARRHLRAGRLDDFPSQLREAMEILDHDTAGRVSLPELAQRVGWSLPHLHAMFRVHLEVAPHQWQLRRRLRRAQERLLGTSDSIKEIAHDLGFHDSAALVRAFKKFSGCTPGFYREEHSIGSHRRRSPTR